MRADSEELVLGVLRRLRVSMTAKAIEEQLALSEWTIRRALRRLQGKGLVKGETVRTFSRPSRFTLWSRV